MIFFVVVEWDGKKPPRNYYNKLSRLGLSTRKSKSGDAHPSFRRANGIATIPQEGCIFTTSESLARKVAGIAADYGAFVTVGEAYIPTGFPLYDKSGRLSSVKQPTISLTCLEEGKAFASADPEQCPSCGGFVVRSSGLEDKVKIRLTGNPVEDWVKARFADGLFKIKPVEVSDDTEDRHVEVKFASEKEANEVSRMLASDDFNDLYVISSDAFRVLDAVFCSRVYIGAETFQRNRAIAVVKLIQEVGVRSPLTSDVPMIVDGAAIMDHKKIVALYKERTSARQERRQQYDR